MTKPVRLSHTSINTYEECPFKYKLKYVDKYVSKFKGSALCFGSAIDTALNHLLLNKEDVRGAIFRFDRAWCKQSDNTSKKKRLKGSDFVVYYKSDLSVELINNKDQKRIELCPGVEYSKLASWYSMRRKGHILIKAYYDQLLPKISKVISAQKNIEYVNENGDIVVGVIDLIAELLDGRIAILDNKTSSVKYKEESVRDSVQLGMYKWIMEETDPLNVQAIGYLVVNKKLLKNNVVKTQYLVEGINDEVIEKTINKINDIVEQIKNEEFPQNYNSCKTFYGYCDYYRYCKNDGDMSDLIDKKKKE